MNSLHSGGNACVNASFCFTQYVSERSCLVEESGENNTIMAIKGRKDIGRQVLGKVKESKEYVMDFTLDKLQTSALISTLVSDRLAGFQWVL